MFKDIKKSLEIKDGECKFLEKNVQVRNIVASCQLGYSLNLDKLCECPEHSEYSTYDDNFPGLIYKYMINK